MKSPNDASDLETAAERAKWVVQAIYPEANAFEAYNVVDEWTEADAVLEFVVGSSATEVLVDQSPIVMWQFRESCAKSNTGIRDRLLPSESCTAILLGFGTASVGTDNELPFLPFKKRMKL